MSGPKDLISGIREGDQLRPMCLTPDEESRIVVNGDPATAIGDTDPAVILAAHKAKIAAVKDRPTGMPGRLDY